MHHQVVANSNLAGIKTMLEQNDVQKSGIQYDVAMVGNEEVALTWIQVFKTTGT